MAKRHPLHSICPYFAMFPEEFVERHVLAHSSIGDLVFDPFSGRGTTAFQSLLMDRRSAGTDINPVAACISGAKVNPPSLIDLLTRIEELRVNYVAPRIEGLGVFFERCFHPSTLPQIVYLRTELDWQGNITDRFIAAMALGALHGESHRSRLCFSNRMPRTISTKPDYSVRWWASRNLEAPERDVFSILKELAKFRLAMGAPERRGTVILSDARSAAAVHPDLHGQVRLVVTSPPYVDVTDYAEDQWLRLWFLGGAPEPKARSYADDRHTKQVSYWNFLTEVWSGMRDLLADNATIVVRIGGKVELEELSVGLANSMETGFGGKAIRMLGGASTSELRKRQTNAFRPGTKAGVEHDFVFEVSDIVPITVPLNAVPELAHQAD
ncbi:DNA methyltransferase [Sphingopyxis sp. LARHCG72]